MPKTPLAGALKRTRGGKFAANAMLALLAGGAAPFANLSHTVPPQTAERVAARSRDLLYVVNFGEGTVGVYEYPAGKLTATLSGFTHPEGACTDPSGNVYVANTGAHDILEYAHGQTRIVRTLGDETYTPGACAVDPLTGDLAVANDRSKHRVGSVAIYRAARGEPQYYTGLDSYLSCAFDDRGNLFVDGQYQRNYYLEELRRGASAFQIIHFSHFQVLRNIGWDGEYITDEVPETNWSVIYRFKFAGQRADLEGVTTVSRSGSAFYDRPRIVITGRWGPAIFEYPSGIGATKKIVDDHRPVASVVSRSSI